MPTPIAEYCEVKHKSGLFRDWISVTVRWGMEEAFVASFSLQLTEPDPKALKLAPGDRVDISLGGKEVIKDGYIKTRQASYDANRHAVRIDGLAKAGPMLEVSVDRKDVQFQDYTFEAIANKLLKPVGVKFKFAKKPKGAEEKFKNVIIHQGERIYEALERLARQRAIWLSTDGDGTVVGGDAEGGGGGGAQLEEGVNILRASSYIEYPWADKYVTSGQNQGSDELFGRRVAAVSATSTIENGDKGKTVVEPIERPTTQKEAQSRADMGAKDIVARTLRVAVTHQGWFKPGTQELWKLRDPVSIKSPMLFPSGEEQMSLNVFSVTWNQSESGTTTTVELVNPKALGGTFQTNQDLFSGAQPQDAQPEPEPSVPSQ
jgi:prophage tail gpP-like protein